MANLANMPYFWRWEETKEPRENPQRHDKSMLNAA